MPVMDCVKDGQPGKKCGPGGTCYTGPDAEDKAKAQCAAEHAGEESKDEGEV